MSNDDLSKYFIEPETPPIPADQNPHAYGQEINAQRSRGTILLLHGFDPWYPDDSQDPRTDIQPFFNRVRNKYEPLGFTVLCPIYPTNVPFLKGASVINAYLKANNVSRTQLYIFGYSMGGLVARSLVAYYDFRPRALITFCTPHEGTANWITWAPWNDGAKSMMQISSDLAKLNRNELDREARNPAYYFIGLGYNEYKNSKKRHDNDQLVEVTSAIMFNDKYSDKTPKKYYLSRYEWPVQIGILHAAAQKNKDIEYAWNAIVEKVRVY